VSERIIVAAVRDGLAFPENLPYLFKRVEEEVGKLYADCRTPSGSSKPSSKPRSGATVLVVKGAWYIF
jgi:hypothetical protein